MFGRIKIDAADRIFSLAVRWRDSWQCQRCNRQFEVGDKRLGCSHFHSRRKENTRFDLDNCDALCNMPCHSEWEHAKGETVGINPLTGNAMRLPQAYRRWKINQLGETLFNQLDVRANTFCKRDRAMALLVAREQLKEFKTRSERKTVGKKS